MITKPIKDNLIAGIQKIYSDKIIDLFQTLPSGSEIYLFGSRAKGNFREGSDIDLSLKGTQISTDDLNHYQSKYFDLNLPWRLDLVIYNNISEPALKEHIDRVGKLLLKIG